VVYSPYVIPVDSSSSAVISSGGDVSPTADPAPPDVADPSPSEKAETAVQAQRFLRVENATGERLTVCVQYRCLTEDGDWGWFPADPATSTDAITVRLDPGQVMNIQDQGSDITASRVRIWGMTATRKWLTYQGQDLWLVTEQDNQGRHRYFAPEMGTFTFTFDSVR
jgi:hypothetical protein